MLLAKINKITNGQAALVIAAIGFLVFCIGLSNPFWGDDLSQIVNNVTVHSLSHVGLFFRGGTFYTSGQGLTPLSGTYYRPLMTTVFSLLYAIGGGRSFDFHLFQLLLYTSSAFILYLIFRYTFKPVLALFLALVFLVHPLNSQLVYSIASTQDVLFFFFGILALYILIRFNTVKSLIPVAVCIFLSMLSKEMGAAFILISLLFLFWFKRERLFAFIGIMIIPVAAYLTLRFSAVGITGKLAIAPIDTLNFSQRLFTIPSIALFYIEKFIFPWRLATGYYWVVRSFSFSHVFIPLIIDLAAVGTFIYLGIQIKKKLSKAQYYTYLFFAIWVAIGLIPYLQIIPLDMTACETWLYLSMAGLLGMIGLVLTAYPLRINKDWLIIIAALFIVTLGFRTLLRGHDWSNKYTLASEDVTASPEDYPAYDVVVNNLIQQGKYNEAVFYTRRSISIYAEVTNYNNLGVALVHIGEYPAAEDAFNHSLSFHKESLIYENLGELALVYGSYSLNKQIFQTALTKYPQDSTMWMYLSILLEAHGDNAGAKIAIAKAADYGQISQQLYLDIYNNQPFIIGLGNTGRSLRVQ